MAKQATFGRRPKPQGAAQRWRGGGQDGPSLSPMPQSAASPAEGEMSLDAELEEWRAARRRERGLVQIPWRSVSLMASLCFGIASLVLPGSVGEAVQWLLYGLTAASLYGGLKGRWAKLSG